MCYAPSRTPRLNNPPPTLEVPIVHEFKYLGIIISKELSEKQVYAATVAKFRLRLETAKAYGGPLYWRILYHKIFAISVFSHLVQFMLPSTSLCNSVDTLSHSFLDPMKTESLQGEHMQSLLVGVLGGVFLVFHG